jgi:PIN domain nuclease of toxin-antitoxin system
MWLLDTHVWIWSREGAPGLGRKACRVIERAAVHDRLRVSVVSLLEVSTLCASGRLRLALPVNEWVDTALATPGVRLAELTTAIAVDAGQIPRAALADPMDRLLAASARRLDASLVTADRALLRFAEAHGLRTVDASR